MNFKIGDLVEIFHWGGQYPSYKRMADFLNLDKFETDWEPEGMDKTNKTFKTPEVYIGRIINISDVGDFFGIRLTCGKDVLFAKRGFKKASIVNLSLKKSLFEI